jgi:hypothetical protein
VQILAVFCSLWRICNAVLCYSETGAVHTIYLQHTSMEGRKIKSVTDCCFVFVTTLKTVNKKKWQPVDSTVYI